jgi:predicted RNA-binding Zn-ribbon protein involved in translation (DUF1610 family)
MASQMIGRADCPECGFKAAHVKQSEKCLYRYCPECGSQHYARNDMQRTNLMAKTRLVDGTATGSEEEKPAPSTTGSEGETDATDTGSTAPVVAPAPTPAPKRRGLFS